MRFVFPFTNCIKIVFTIYLMTIHLLYKKGNISLLKGTFLPVVASSLDFVKSTPTPLKSLSFSPPHKLQLDRTDIVGSILGVDPRNLRPSIQRNSHEHLLLPLPRNLHH